MGELVDAGSALQGGWTLLSGLLSVAALGVYALMNSDPGNNDDDDSGPGGGLMQPVA